MPEESKRNGTIKLAGFVLLVAGLFASILLAWGDQKGDIKAQGQKVDTHLIQSAKDTTALKDDGCDPAKANTTSIAVLEVELKNIKQAQTDNTAAIIKAIKDTD